MLSDPAGSILAILNPWSTPLDVKNHEYVTFLNLSQQEIDTLGDRSVMDLFNRYITGVCMEEEINKDKIIKDITPALSLDELSRNDFNKRFFEFPVHEKMVRDAIENFTVEEIKKLAADLVGEHLPVDLLLELMEHTKANLRNECSVDTFQDSNDLWNVLFVKFSKVAKTAEEIIGMYQFFMNFAVSSSGFRAVAKDLYESDSTDFSDANDFYSMHLMLKSEGFRWITRPVFVDYVLSKLQENIGGVEGYKIICQVFKYREKFSIAQWCGLIECYDTVKNVPMSWWRSIISVGSEKE